MKILITGASGFIGSFIVEEALRRGFETWAAMRRTSSHQFLSDERTHFIELNLSDQQQLQQQLSGHQFDYVVHAAGVTKCLDPQDFYRINTEGTKNLVGALLALKMPLRRFVYISSLSIFGAIREQQPYQEICETDTPQPNTAYGESKLAAEQYDERELPNMEANVAKYLRILEDLQRRMDNIGEEMLGLEELSRESAANDARQFEELERQSERDALHEHYIERNMRNISGLKERDVLHDRLLAGVAGLSVASLAVSVFTLLRK